MILSVAKRSLLDRKYSVLLTFIALFVSVCLLISIEHVRKEAKQSFYRTVSGVDLIVGARTGQINLLLSSVFRIGANANALSWESYQRISQHPLVEWSIPLSLGDSHKGYAVIGTTNDYFEHYRYGDKRELSFDEGNRFGYGATNIFDMVIGADIAKQLNYNLGDQVVISHGVGEVSFSHHGEHPFTIVGILAATGTPVDQAIHIKLSAVEAVHSKPSHTSALSRPSATKSNEEHKAELHEHEHKHEHEQHGPEHERHEHKQHEHEHAQHESHAHDEHAHSEPEPSQISAFMLGLQSRIAVLQLQRQINQDKQEALSAIIPGVALAELWRLVGAVESVLRLISSAVLVASLLGLTTMLLSSLRERKPELAVLRVMGARPSFIFWLIQLEAMSIALCASVSALFFVFMAIFLSSDWMLTNYGISLGASIFTVHTLLVVALVMCATFIIALAPSISAYRRSRLV
ncbi:FtsX-like permease family protein [Glaciecola sp. MH2013]|uniref:ABC transporter permease n=1 Tax=Glaciecola sp. MH2013 TaxID=2785524 RepID=UPI00189DE72D|nr:ABC transporter permease [Glaciecola sp. MH2013]MBF7073746.1 FtsX-like permease family protein [Glaciecola sp. MH2013]